MTTKTPSKNKKKTVESKTVPSIVVRGARVNTLKNITVKIPHKNFTVITGPSGSGKSSLAFDTLYAEGQRRFIESMSSYARQFLARIEKPDVDEITHILPSVALQQKNTIRNARSTVGTATEVYDYLRVLMTHLGTTVCPDCEEIVSRLNPKAIEKWIQGFEDGAKLMLLAPVSLASFPTDALIKRGFFRLWHKKNNEGELIDFSVQKELPDDIPAKATVDILIDRLIIRHDKKSQISARLMESIAQALQLGKGKLIVESMDTGERHTFDTEFSCPGCQKVFEEPSANLFSFNSPIGACPSCEGFGRVIDIDYDKVMPNKNLSIAEGVVHPFTTPSNAELQDDLFKEAKKRKINLDTPYKKLPDTAKAFVMDGGGDYPGVRKFFNWLESKKYKMHVRILLAKYRGYYPCPECEGSRLRQEAMNVRLLDVTNTTKSKNLSDGKTIDNLCQMSIEDLHEYFKSLELTELQAQVANRVLDEINSRLDYLVTIGLDYLTLARQSRTLSGGEAQRINLATALGYSLTETLYVLDEPTVGLHARDTDRLVKVLKSLRDKGNTVVVVEHDPEVIEEADNIIDMGPAGGEEGGRIVFEGTLEDLLDTNYSLTSQYLNDRNKTGSKKKAEKSTAKKSKKSDVVKVIGASGNNLDNVDIEIPLHQLVCVTGVSGSGKSTLIKQTLFTQYEHANGRSLDMDSTPCVRIEGLGLIENEDKRVDELIFVDQTPPGRSARSNPATFVKAFDDVRKLFADTRKAMALNLTVSDFSFNSGGGRCETCEGLGTISIDMQFMADVTVTCHECQGRRYTRNVLGVEVEGKDAETGKQVSKNIYQVLELTVNEALVFFENQPRLIKKLKPIVEIGLGYLKLGQSTATLSGGEAQRLKLSAYLQPKSRKNEDKKGTLFLFDEPTTGLHMADIDRLADAFKRLIEEGHSVVVIEHNIDFVRHADHIVDMGPGGGVHGGQIVATGTVSDIKANKKSVMGSYL